jgi:acyl-homoserine lactone synthase
LRIHTSIPEGQMRIHVIDERNRKDYARELDEHHRLRHDIYIGERGWRALRGEGGRERDQFDLPDAVYLLAISDDGAVAGGTRLLQSTGPTLLSEIFPYLADVRPFDRGPDIMEWTRFFVAPRFRESGRLCRAGGLISAGIIEYCLQQGIHKLNAVGETFWMPRISALGWRPRPLGLPVEHEGMSICAWTIDITEFALQTTLSVYALPGIRLLSGIHDGRRIAATAASKALN